ncbi:MAG: hypothetical protein ABIO57_04190 [Candidatus Paceibacterota bacterium]
MKVGLQNDLQGKKWYWKTKKWLKNGPIFLLWKHYFSFENFTVDSKKSIGLLRSSIKTVIISILYALVSIGAFEYLQIKMPIGSFLQIIHLPLISIKDNTVDSFLTTVASVSGVFLALYFASVFLNQS